MQPSTLGYVLLALINVIFSIMVFSIPLHDEYTDNFDLVNSHENYFEEDLFRWSYIEDANTICVWNWNFIATRI